MNKIATCVGVVIEWDRQLQTGTIVTPDGNRLSFAYADGESLMLDQKGVGPCFSGRHEQPAGYSLKLPKVGDAVVFEGKRTVVRWSYIDSFLWLTTRRYGTDFVGTSRRAA